MISEQRHGQHHSSSISSRGIAIFIAIMLATIGVGALVNDWVIQDFAADWPGGHIPARPLPMPPEPHLQLSPPRDMAGLRERENRVLKTYGWVDRESGVVRVPIDRAIELMTGEKPPNEPLTETIPPPRPGDPAP